MQRKCWTKLQENNFNHIACTVALKSVTCLRVAKSAAQDSQRSRKSLSCRCCCQWWASEIPLGFDAVKAINFQLPSCCVCLMACGARSRSLCWWVFRDVVHHNQSLRMGWAGAPQTSSRFPLPRPISGSFKHHACSSKGSSSSSSSSCAMATWRPSPLLLYPVIEWILNIPTSEGLETFRTGVDYTITNVYLTSP